MTAGKILIVENNSSNAEALQLLLESEHFNVISLKGRELLNEVLQRFSPDLVLMDILLDHDDGRLICRELKQLRAQQQIPVMLITAMLEKDALLLDSGADALMFKPFESSNLIATVSRLLEANNKLA
ncbi:response regulator [Pedobacter sp. GSP4]|uniref:response regulator n=1 Tax=Pedobacter sp. GSP4 TaxID=3453716 RepID=UPI003EEDB1B1